MGFQENNPGVFEFKDENQSLTGVLIKVQHDVGPSDSMLYSLEVDGKPWNVWGSTILDQRMIGIKVGDLIRITFKGLGEAKPGKNAPKIFKVELDDGKSDEPEQEEQPEKVEERVM